MIRRKTRKRLRHLFRIAVTALVMNSIFPLHAAQAANVKAAINPVKAAVVEETPVETTVTSPTLSASLPKVETVPAKRKFVVRASAYTSAVEETDSDPFTTASGKKVRPGTVAANCLPFGTKLRIPQQFGERVFTVEDRMHSRWGCKKIDLWMKHRADAIQWGVRTITVEIL